MDKEKIVLKIDSILLVIGAYEITHPQHINSTTFLKEKYESMRKNISSNNNLTEIIEWNKWFAPRIIYEGINHEELIEKVNELNYLFSKIPPCI